MSVARTGLASAALALVLVAGCGGGSRAAPRPTPHPPAGATVAASSTTLRLSSLADAYVAAGRGEHGFGPTLRVDGSPLTRSYVAFALGAVPGRIVQASLRLYAMSGSRTGFAVDRADGVRLRGQTVALPAAAASAPGPNAVRSGGFRPRAWRTVDVTRLVAGARGTVTFAVLPRTRTEVTLASAESGARAPQLVVRTVPAGSAAGSPAAYAGRIRVPAGRAPTIAAAGDIACDPRAPDFHAARGDAHGCAMRATSNLMLGLKPTLVLTLGDNQYEDSGYANYLRAYAPTWGRLKAVTRPAVGNHEYLTPDATGYFRYFGGVAGGASRAWYSFDLGAWHVVELNSECGHVGGCGPGSPEEQWLRADLAAHRARCTLAYWHEPRFSSGQHGDAQAMATLWNDLARAHADMVLSGHNHDYERFAPAGVTPQGQGGVGGLRSFQAPVLDPAGIRAFVVGTGGRNLYGFPHRRLTGEAVRNNRTYGVLALTLRPAGYDWRFVPVRRSGRTFTDAGTGRCH